MVSLSSLWARARIAFFYFKEHSSKQEKDFFRQGFCNSRSYTRGEPYSNIPMFRHAGAKLGGFFKPRALQELTRKLGKSEVYGKTLVRSLQKTLG